MVADVSSEFTNITLYTDNRCLTHLSFASMKLACMLFKEFLNDGSRRAMMGLPVLMDFLFLAK